MLASQTPDLMIETENDLAHAKVNAALRVAFGFERFALAVIRDNIHAAKTGARVKDAYVNPDAREKGDNVVKTFPTDARISDVVDCTARVRTLATLAARCHRDDIGTVETAARAELARMSMLDRDLWNVWVKSEKAHIDGPSAAMLEVDGFAWTESRKGHGTEIRYSDSADKGMRAYKSLHTGATPRAYLSERDMETLS